MHLRRLIGAATLGVFTLSTTAMAETWRFGLEEIEGSVQHRYAEQFEKRIEERSNGDIDVQLLPYGKWGSSYSALYDAIQGGAIQIGFASGALGGTVPESQLLNLNYIMQVLHVGRGADGLVRSPYLIAFGQLGQRYQSPLTEGVLPGVAFQEGV